MTVGSTLQFTVYGVYSNGSVAALPDAEGDVVTAWEYEQPRSGQDQQSRPRYGDGCGSGKYRSHDRYS